jgi:hypothetical protein
VDDDEDEQVEEGREQQLRYWSERFSVSIDELRITWRLYAVLNGKSDAVPPRSGERDAG